MKSEARLGDKAGTMRRLYDGRQTVPGMPGMPGMPGAGLTWPRIGFPS